MARPVTLRADASDELALLGAAYLMTQDAYVGLGRRGKETVVTLWPKAGGRVAELATAFAREYENQLRRWAIARQGRELRAETLRRAISRAEEAGGKALPVQPGLSAEQKAEMAALLAEAEKDPKDPFGIATTWEEIRKAGGDKP